MQRFVCFSADAFMSAIGQERSFTKYIVYDRKQTYP